MVARIMSIMPKRERAGFWWGTKFHKNGVNKAMNSNKLGSSIAVMNAKGGVGKSTVTLAIAETLSHDHHKKILVIDSDAQMSISVMLMAFDELNQKRADWKTLVGLLHQTLILGQTPDWREFVTQNVADVDDAETVDILPGDLRLTLVERAVTEADRHEQMRGLVRSVLAEARLAYDYVLIDCPPGLSLLTEIWLREADYHLAPVKPDFLAIAGLEMFREFKNINPDMKMAENLGILINMKHYDSVEDNRYHETLENDRESNCFPCAIPHMSPIQHAARHTPEGRSLNAKYPGSAGQAFRYTAEEIMRRTGDSASIHADVGLQYEAQAAPVVAAPNIAEALDVSLPITSDPLHEPVEIPRPAAAPVPLAQEEAAEIASKFAPEGLLEKPVPVSSAAIELEALSMTTEQAKPKPVAAPKGLDSPAAAEKSESDIGPT